MKKIRKAIMIIYILSIRREFSESYYDLFYRNNLMQT